jgi:8-oxo-dGTP diphosphatase
MSQIRVRVTVVVEHQGSILLIKEKTGKESHYSLPGGCVEFLETIPDAVRREVWEETGLLVEFERLLWLDERIEKTVEGKHTIGVGVLAKLVGEETTPIPGGLEDEQIVWTGWVTLAELCTSPLYDMRGRDQVVKALTDQGYIPAYIDHVR